MAMGRNSYNAPRKGREGGEVQGVGGRRKGRGKNVKEKNLDKKKEFKKGD